MINDSTSSFFSFLLIIPFVVLFSVTRDNIAFLNNNFSTGVPPLHFGKLNTDGAAYIHVSTLGCGIMVDLRNDVIQERRQVRYYFISNHAL